MSKRKPVGKPWLGRIQFAITQDLMKAAARFPWAVSFIQIKSGVWCFEDPRCLQSSDD